MTCALAGIVVMQYVSDSNTEYSITYELNGGVNSENNPTTYKAKSPVTLSDPTYYGHVFNGWFSDSEFTEKVTVVSSGNVTLYASWTELKKIGSVTYILDGGTNAEGNHTVRYEGVDITLGAASKEGYLFNGWCSAPEHTDIVSVIPSTVEGDITLYAWWVEIYAGKGFTLSYQNTSSNGNVAAGSLRVEYVYYNAEKGFFARNTVTNQYGMSSSSTYWTSENQNDNITWTFKGMEQIYAANIDGGKYVYCEVYEGTSETTATVNSFYSKETVVTTTTETQYIYDGWIPVKIVYEKTERTARGPFIYTSSSRIDYTLKETFEFDPPSTFKVDISADVGIEVHGDGPHQAASGVTLTATASAGYEFGGWYDAQGTLLSTSPTYTVKAILADTSIYAHNKDDVDFEREYGEDTELYRVDGLTDITWVVVNRETGEMEAYTGGAHVFAVGGYYDVSYSGKLGETDYHGYYSLYADGDVVKSFTWYYDSNGNGNLNDPCDKYTYDLTVRYNDYLEYRNRTVSRQNGTDAENLAYITPDDKYIAELADHFESICGGMNDYKTMSIVLAFTQYIEYRSDETHMGRTEYWKFPLETLFDQGGDCEDTSILFCSIASAMGYRSAMLLFYGHMAGAVELEDGSVSEYSGTPAAFPSKDGQITYYYCETTTAGYAVGQPATEDYTYGGFYYKMYNMGNVISVPAS